MRVRRYNAPLSEGMVSLGQTPKIKTAGILGLSF